MTLWHDGSQPPPCRSNRAWASTLSLGSSFESTEFSPLRSACARSAKAAWWLDSAFFCAQEVSDLMISRFTWAESGPRNIGRFFENGLSRNHAARKVAAARPPRLAEAGFLHYDGDETTPISVLSLPAPQAPEAKAQRSVGGRPVRSAETQIRRDKPKRGRSPR
jgi:hypothetical protein